MVATMTKPEAIENYIKSYINPLDIYGTLRPVLQICGYMGILPIRFSKGRYRVSKFRILISAIHMVWFGICFVITFQSECIFKQFIESDGLAFVAEIFQLATSFAAMTIVYSHSFRNRYKFIAAIAMLAAIDDHFRKINRPQQHYRHMLRYVFVCALCMSIVIIVYLFGCALLMWYADQDTSIYSWVSYLFPHIIIMLLVFKYISVLHQIKIRFVCLNKVCVSFLLLR